MNTRHPHPWAVLLLLRWAMGIRRLGTLTGWQSPRHRGPVVSAAQPVHRRRDCLLASWPCWRPTSASRAAARVRSWRSECSSGELCLVGRSREFRLGEPQSTPCYCRAREAPAFDAAVAADIFDMYGPAKDASRAAMEKLMRDTFGYRQEVLALYLAAYAMATMTMFGSSEEDGHFHWCAEVLRRPDVPGAL
jgi:hypothetical protein